MSKPPHPEKQHLDVLAIGLLLACCLYWGFNQVLVKASLAELPPLVQAGFRFCGAALLLAAWCRWRGIALWQRSDGVPAILGVAVLFALEFLCIYGGLTLTSASRLTLFLYTAPFWVAALLPLWLPTERLGAVQWLGLACAFVAVTLALGEFRWGGTSKQLNGGDLLGLAAGMLWGLTTVIIRASKLRQIPAERLLFYQVAACGVSLTLLSVVWGESWQGLWAGFGFGDSTAKAWSGFAWFSLFMQTVVGAFGSYLVWMWMLGRYPATRMSSFVFLTPVFALVFGAWWLGEVVTPLVLTAMALVALGIVLVNRRTK